MIQQSALNIRNPGLATQAARKRSRQAFVTGRCSQQAGFTLIEVMIVLAIIAGVMAAGAPRLFNSSTEMRKTIRELALRTREIRNNSRLFNQTTRLALKMSDKEGHSYWIESASGTTPLMTQEMEEELNRLTQAQREAMSQKNQFSAETRLMKKPLSLPRGLFIESVEYASRKEPVTAGIAYIHFFPQGLAEEAVIHLTDKKTLNWTIAINPLTGRADVFERKVMLKELRD